MQKKVLLIFLICALASCKDQGGLQKKLSDALGLKTSRKGGSELTPSKEDQESFNNSIQGCPKDAKLFGKAYPRGSLQYCAYKDEKGEEIKHGEFRKWHSDGKLESKSTYVDGELEGPVVTYFDNGQVKDQATYLHGQTDGPQNSFNKEGGKVSLTTFKGGFKNGLFIKYDKSGKVEEKGQYQNDMKNGSWEFFSRDGVIKEKSEYRNDVRHGKSIRYNRNGQPLSQGFYSSNEEIGHWIYFNNRGLKKTEGNFIDGKKHGRWADYNSQGQEVRNTFYDYGKKLDSYSLSANAKANGGSSGFGKGDIFGEEPTRQQQNTYNRPKGESSAPSSLENEGWNPL